MPARNTSLKSNDAWQPATPAPNVTPRFPVVGIGASAGGLEAMTSLLKELESHLGMAYVLVLHLDPARESKVSEILARTTPIPVVQAQEGMRVEPDHIYVIPPNRDMTIDHWVLHLQGPGTAQIREYDHRHFPEIVGGGPRQRRHRRHSFRNRI